MREIGIFHQRGLVETIPQLGPEVLPTVSQAKIVLATGSRRRVDPLYDWVHASGLPKPRVEVVNGWASEPGLNAAQKALSKVFHAVDVVLDKRELTGLNLLIGSDAINYAAGKMREKPRSTADIENFRDEWLKTQRDREVIAAEVGMAVIAVFNGRFSVATSLDRLGLIPISREYIERSFMINPGLIMQNAHGLSSFAGISNGDIIVVELSGEVYPDLRGSLTPREAIERIDGVGPRRLDHLVSTAIKPFGIIDSRA